MGLTLLTGGARSGKSLLAIELAKRSGNHVSVIATGQARDDEMSKRIDVHRDERPWDWTVIEEATDLSSALEKLADGSVIIIDCLTLWVSNLMETGATDEEIVEKAQAVADPAARSESPVIVVTNEVGSGIVPMSDVARRYRDLLGAVNKVFARAATRSYLVVAGRALPLDDPDGIELS